MKRDALFSFDLVLWVYIGCNWIMQVGAIYIHTNIHIFNSLIIHQNTFKQTYNIYTNTFSQYTKLHTAQSIIHILLIYIHFRTNWWTLLCLALFSPSLSSLHYKNTAKKKKTNKMITASSMSIHPTKLNFPYIHSNILAKKYSNTNDRRQLY